MAEYVELAMDCQEVIALLAQALQAQGLRVYRSFDLRNALASLPDCGCPHHGTAQCTCQYAVLLVYGDAPSPALVVAHGRDGRTWLKLPEAGTPSAALHEGIQRTLDVLLNAGENISTG